MHTPISVYITAYNAEEFLAEAIESVLAQTYPHFELLLLNDGSQDRTLEVMRAYAANDDRLRVHSNPNEGTGAAANRALSLARHELVARMDADDRMLPRRLETQVRYMEANPDVTVVSCLAYYINGKGTRFGQIYSDLLTKEDHKRYLLHQEPIGLLHPGVMYRKTPILAMGGYRPYRHGQDKDLWNRLAEMGHVIVVQDEMLMEYRLHSSSSGMKDTMKMYRSHLWGQENIRRRRSNQPEVTFDEFAAQQQQIPPSSGFSGSESGTPTPIIATRE